MALASATPITPTIREEWRPIEKFNGRYEVSNHGRVRRLFALNGAGVLGLLKPRAAPKMLIPQRGAYGYVYVPLEIPRRPGEKRKQRKVQVHCAVALAFLGKRPNGYHAAHLDGDRANPCLENLAYVTPTENSAHRKVHGTCFGYPRGEQALAAKLCEADVLAIRELRRTTHLNNREIARLYGISHETVRCICSRLNWTHLP